MNLNKFLSFEFLGRILFTTTFLVAVPPKVLKFDTVVDAIVLKGISPGLASFLLVSAIIFLLLGSLLFLLGKARYGSALLLLFLVPTTVIFHLIPFDSQSFFMNIGLIGALIIFFNRLDVNLELGKTHNSFILFTNMVIKSIILELSKLLKK